MAEALAKLGKLSEAAQIYKRLTELDSTDDKSYLNIARIANKLDAGDLGIHFSLQWKQNCPDDPLPTSTWGYFTVTMVTEKMV